MTKRDKNSLFARANVFLIWNTNQEKDGGRISDLLVLHLQAGSPLCRPLRQEAHESHSGQLKAR